VAIPVWSYVLALLLFVFVIWFVDHALSSSRQSGWRELARTYAYGGDFEGTSWRFPDVSFRRRKGWTGFGITLVLGVNSRGLYMRHVRPFQVSHPALLVPWSDIRFGEPSKGFWGRRVSLFLGSDPAVEMSAGGLLVDRLLAHRRETSAVA
jgi:hypothetical protein